MSRAPTRIVSVAQQARSNRSAERWARAAVAALALFVVAVGTFLGSVLFMLAFAVLLFGAIAILVYPLLGVYLIVFFSVVSEYQGSGWYPWSLNFSSRGSVLFVHDALSLSPLDLYLGLTLLSWLVRAASDREARAGGGELRWPMAAFGTMAFAGLVWGVGVRGGDRVIAIWEFRPVLYLPLMYLLTSKLFTRTAHYRAAFAVALAALVIHDGLAYGYYAAMSAETRAALETLTEHQASVLYAWCLLLLVALVAFRGGSARWRIPVAVIALPTAGLFVLSQRRAAFVGLAFGFIVFSIVLAYRRRRAFRVMVPTVTVLALGYTAAFWNSTSGIGFGARAVKSVFASDTVSERDAASNIYRTIENVDLLFTIRTEPLTGVGFGRPFYQPYALPDISFFEFYQYIPHNSVLYIWLKMGYPGFVALLLTLAFAIRAGIRAALRLPSGDHLAINVAALAYVTMFSVFAFVDIAWEARTSVFLAVCMATCANYLTLWEHEHAVVPAGRPARRHRNRSRRRVHRSVRHPAYAPARV